MTQQSGHIPTPLFTKHCAISAPDLTSTARISKSESPQPPPKYMSPSGATLQPPEQHLGISLSRDSTSASSKHISALEPRHTPVFSLGVDSDEELEPIRQRRESNASRTSRTSRDTRSREKSRHKDRFKKILKPLRRSHSAGSTKDVPAHALFLRHDITKERKTPVSQSWMSFLIFIYNYSIELFYSSNWFLKSKLSFLLVVVPDTKPASCVIKIKFYLYFIHYQNALA